MLKMFNKAQNAQNVHQHMLSTFRDKPGNPRVRTVPDSPGGSGGLPRSQQPSPASPGHVVMPSPAQPYPAMPSCPGDQGVCPVSREFQRSLPRLQGVSQAMCRPCGRAMLPMTVTSHPGSVKG